MEKKRKGKFKAEMRGKTSRRMVEARPLRRRRPKDEGERSRRRGWWRGVKRKERERGGGAVKIWIWWSK